MQYGSKNLRLSTHVLHEIANEVNERTPLRKPLIHFANQEGKKSDPAEEILLIRLLWEKGGWTIANLVEYFGKSATRINSVVNYGVRPRIRTEGCIVPEIFYELSKRPYHKGEEK